MLALARALVTGPRLLLLDEPSAGLAPKVVDEVFEKLAEINRSGVAILMVEQNARRSLALSRYGYVLDMGRNRYRGRAPSCCTTRRSSICTWAAGAGWRRRPSMRRRPGRGRRHEQEERRLAWLHPRGHDALHGGGRARSGRLARALDWLLAERMHGIAVAGTTGEWFSLYRAERIELFRSAAGHVGGRMTVLAGCNAFTPREVDRLRARGARGRLRRHPAHAAALHRAERAEVVAWYRAVSDAVEIPICVYNWPRGTGVDIDAGALLRARRARATSWR